MILCHSILYYVLRATTCYMIGEMREVHEECDAHEHGDSLEGAEAGPPLKSLEPRQSAQQQAHRQQEAQGGEVDVPLAERLDVECSIAVHSAPSQLSQLLENGEAADRGDAADVQAHHLVPAYMRICNTNTQYY